MEIFRCPRARQTKPLPSFTWEFEPPAGSASRLENTTTLRVRFTPDRVGQYLVRLIACPNKCVNRLITDHTPTGKPINELVEIGPTERVMTIDVVAEAQLAPLYVPAPLPSVSPGTRPQHYGDSRGHCGDRIGIGTGTSPQWFTTAIWTTPTPPYTLVEGRVYHTGVSRKDHPASHNSNDANPMVEVDPPFRHLLVDDSPEDKGELLPFGGLQIEWERDEWPEAFRPVQGDRISALGFHAIDCGHGKYTELHPPIAVAVHRPGPVVLPPRLRFQDTDILFRSTGRNVVVPGIITDLWANLRGGQALDCNNAALHQPVFTPGPNGAPVHLTCVKQPTTAGQVFEFRIFLPQNPIDRLKEIGVRLPVRPGLYFAIQNHPEAGALRASSNVSVRVVERHTSGPTPFVRVRVALSEMKTREKFAKRFVAAWVYPDHDGANFGLRALRVKLNQLEVTNDGDPFLKGDGDWRFWAVVSSLTRPWTELIDCNGCVEDKAYSPRAGIFRPGAFDSEGTLTGEVLLFNGQLGSFQLTGFESDLLVSDDAGNVFTAINGVTSASISSSCNNHDTGLSHLDPSASGCAAYTVNYSIVPGRTPVIPRMSAEMSTFAQQLVVRATQRDQVADIPDSELFTLDRMSGERSKLTVDRPADLELWQEALTTSNLSQAMREGNLEPMIKDLRKHVLSLLGPHPSDKHRRKVALELLELKKSVPPALYQKYLCDLETGQPCRVLVNH